MKSFMIMGLCHMRPKRLVLTKSAKTKYLQKKYLPIVTKVLKMSFLFQNWFFLCDQSASLESVITTVCLCLNNIDATICQKCTILGMGDAIKTDEFSKISQGGGGYFQSQYLCCKFWTFREGFFRTFSEKKCNMIF